MLWHADINLLYICTESTKPSPRASSSTHAVLESLMQIQAKVSTYTCTPDTCPQGKHTTVTLVKRTNKSGYMLKLQSEAPVATIDRSGWEVLPVVVDVAWRGESSAMPHGLRSSPCLAPMARAQSGISLHTLACRPYVKGRHGILYK